MRKILIIGAGKSTAWLTSYLSEKAAENQLQLLVADRQQSTLDELLTSFQNIDTVILDINDKDKRQKLIEETDLVVSMLPARMHVEVAQDCLHFGKHLVTASYVSTEMQALDDAVRKKGLVFMNEAGLDPGIDHMSAMEAIDRIRNRGGKMLLFESFTGGLVAPESDTNLWNYKFTWNPRNVVLAGQGGIAKFLQEGKYKYIPYHKLFRRTEFLKVAGYGLFEAYANRDSLKYKEEYGLKDILTLYRGTIRRVGYSRAWNLFVQMGMTDDSFVIQDSEDMSYRDFVNSFLPYSPSDSVELKMRHYLKIDQDDSIWAKLLELNIFDPYKKVGLKKATPAQILQKILENSWALKHDEKDMIVMYHKFGYELNGAKFQTDSHMVALGENNRYTAMAKTVGLPVGIIALNILNGVIKKPGVQIPTDIDVYKPVLKELKKYKIEFIEKKAEYLGYNPDRLTG